MKATSLDFPGLFLIEPTIHADDRGDFTEVFRKEWFAQKICPACFVQDNESRSKFGVLRGLHFQKAPSAQAKLIRVVRGKIWDCVVDLRPQSPKFKRWYSIELSEENRKLLFVPKGFAHGYLSLSDQTVVQYKVDQYFSKDEDSGLRFDDPELEISWPLDSSQLIISKKDQTLPSLKDIGPLNWD